jgi:hypothetical protein
MRARGTRERAGTWLGESLLTIHQQFQPASGVEPMSLTPTAPPLVGLARAGAGPRRVRHQARDAVALMAFSATSSVAVAGGLMLLAQLGR